MYAVIKTGGKQYKVAENDKLTVEKLDAEAGKVIELADVLMLSDGKAITTGQPLVEGARVMAEVVDQIKGDTIIIFKKQRRKTYKRRNGHRQRFTVLRVTEILAKGQKPSDKSAEKPKAEKPKQVAAEKPEMKTEAKTAPKKAAPKKAEPKKPVAKKAPAKKAPAAERTAPKKAADKKPAAKKSAPAKADAKKTSKKKES